MYFGVKQICGAISAIVRISSDDDKWRQSTKNTSNNKTYLLPLHQKIRSTMMNCYLPAVNSFTAAVPDLWQNGSVFLRWSRLCWDPQPPWSRNSAACWFHWFHVINIRQISAAQPLLWSYDWCWLGCNRGKTKNFFAKICIISRRIQLLCGNGAKNPRKLFVVRRKNVKLLWRACMPATNDLNSQEDLKRVGNLSLNVTLDLVISFAMQIQSTNKWDGDELFDGSGCVIDSCVPFSKLQTK